ncbi:MAG: metallophosphoesterase family protein [Anaerolineaceae bacterium]
MKSFKIGVISDTHVPDRSPEISTEFLSTLMAEQVDLILHAGDISLPRVLTLLETIAPVKAVLGNRDFLLTGKIPMVQQFDVFGVKIALMHGHMNFLVYWLDKLQYVFGGYSRERYIRRLPKAAPDASVIVFGHTHHAENILKEGILYFNPGSITYGDSITRQRTWGIIEVYENGRVDGKIIPCG